jgi:hypothetical protein
MKLDVLYNAVQYTNVSQPGVRKLCVKGQRVDYALLFIFNDISGSFKLSS